METWKTWGMGDMGKKDDDTIGLALTVMSKSDMGKVNLNGI